MHPLFRDPFHLPPYFPLSWPVWPGRRTFYPIETSRTTHRNWSFRLAPGGTRHSPRVGPDGCNWRWLLDRAGNVHVENHPMHRGTVRFCDLHLGMGWFGADRAARR